MNSEQMTRAEWSEGRPNEGPFMVIADWNGFEWEFWERDSWEVRWYPMVSRPDLIAKAESLVGATARRSLPAVAA